NPHLIEALREHVGADLMPAIFEAGYNLDFFDGDALNQVGRIENGNLLLGRNRYKIVILPAVDTIPIDTYRKFEDFVKSGGILVATRRLPAKAPGFLATTENHQEIGGLSKRLFEGPNTQAHFVANEPSQLARQLQQVVKPDIEFVPASSDLGFVHRKTGDAEIYFIANTANARRTVKAYFRVSGMKPAWWNPTDGSVTPAKDESGSLEYSELKLDIEPYGSRILVFSKASPGNYEERVVNASPPRPLEISADWKVSVGNSPASQWSKLRSWTDDEGTRYFSGSATYEKNLTVPSVFLEQQAVSLDFGESIPLTPQSLRSGMQAWLEGPIREAAVVYINERRAGSIWCPPYSLEVRQFLRPGVNTIRIVVANTAMNHMAGRSLPDYRLLNLRYGERFQAQDMDKVQALPSGLLGPIHLIARSQ
ncbi:MAG TPA: glycosyl hydrolase, partial [Pyrinomonadaceae bacterium]